MKPKIYTGILALFCAATTAQANLLISPGFETDPLNGYIAVLSDFVGNAGQWGAESGTISLATGGVTPPEGTHMLSMTGSGTAYQTDQMTYVGSGPIASLIASGNAVVHLSAFFNVGNEVSAGNSAVLVRFFNGADYNLNQTGSVFNSLVLDADEKSWQMNSVSAAIPVGTIWIASELLYGASSLGASPGFVDAADLTITAVPEPGTALFGIACVGVAAIRRRRKAAV